MTDDDAPWGDREVIASLGMSCRKAARELREQGRVDIIWAELETAANYADRYLKTGIYGPEPDPETPGHP